MLSKESGRLTREQLFTIIATASINFSSMICYSILGPFFPREVNEYSTWQAVQLFAFDVAFKFLRKED